MKLLIKLAIEVIQSLVIQVPPLVVDCFPHPDINSGAYYGKKGVVVANYITTQSALFYSYKGELPAKKGELSSKASINNNILAQFWHSFRSENEGINIHSLFQKDEMSLVEMNDHDSCKHEEENKSAVHEIDTTKANGLKGAGTKNPLPPYKQIKKPLCPPRKGEYSNSPRKGRK